MKRALALLCAAVMMVSLLTACGSKTDDNTTQAPGNTENGGFVYDSSKASWEQDTSPIELEWFAAYDRIDLGVDSANNEFDKRVYNDIGVTIKFTIGSQEKLNVLIATGNLPDSVTYDAVSTERKTMEDRGMLLPLDKLKGQHAPNMQASERMMNWYRSESDGNWYAWVSCFSLAEFLLCTAVPFDCNSGDPGKGNWNLS